MRDSSTVLPHEWALLASSAFVIGVSLGGILACFVSVRSPIVPFLTCACLLLGALAVGYGVLGRDVRPRTVRLPPPPPHRADGRIKRAGERFYERTYP